MESVCSMHHWMEFIYDYRTGVCRNRGNALVSCDG